MHAETEGAQDDGEENQEDEEEGRYAVHMSEAISLEHPQQDLPTACCKGRPGAPKELRPHIQSTSAHSTDDKP